MRVLFIGDIVGRPGRRTLQKLLPKVRNTYGPFDFVIANVENSAGGFGITQKVLDDLLAMGIDCMTSGNHIWDKKKVYPYWIRNPSCYDLPIILQAVPAEEAQF